MPAETCGIRHRIPEIVCIRPAGHDGRCWSKWESGLFSIMRTEWCSRDGRFAHHHTYRSKYPANHRRAHQPQGGTADAEA